MENIYSLFSPIYLTTKTFQRVLAPITSTVSQVIFFCENIIHQKTSDIFGYKTHNRICQGEDLQRAIKKQIESVWTLHEAHVSNYPERAEDDLFEICEELEESGDSFVLAIKEMKTRPAAVDAATTLLQASKHLLHSTLKLLKKLEELEISVIESFSGKVKEHLLVFLEVQELEGLTKPLETLLGSVLDLIRVIHRRQSDLIDESCRQKIFTSIITLRKAIPLLVASRKNCVKYPQNCQALTTQDYSKHEILSALDEIICSFHNRGDEKSDKLESLGGFVKTIDVILEALSKERREDPCEDLEVWCTAVIQHSMSVAHLSQDHYRDLAIQACQRILHFKVRVFELAFLRSQNKDLVELKSDYDDTCDCLVSEFCGLERCVNITLLSVIVRTLHKHSQPLDDVVELSLTILIDGTDVENLKLMVDDKLEKFYLYSDCVSQIASLASYSMKNTESAGNLKACIKRLEKLDLEIAPAIFSFLYNHEDAACLDNIRLLQREWSLEIADLLGHLNRLTDPRSFLQLSGEILADDIRSIIQVIDDRQYSEMTQLGKEVLGKIARVISVAKSVHDGLNFPLFRKELEIYTERLNKTLKSLKTSFNILHEGSDDVTVIDTIKRRLNLIGRGITDILNTLQGLSSVNVLELKLRQANEASQGHNTMSHADDCNDALGRGHDYNYCNDAVGHGHDYIYKSDCSVDENCKSDNNGPAKLDVILNDGTDRLCADPSQIDKELNNEGHLKQTSSLSFGDVTKTEVWDDENDSNDLQPPDVSQVYVQNQVEAGKSCPATYAEESPQRSRKLFIPKFTKVHRAKISHDALTRDNTIVRNCYELKNLYRDIKSTNIVNCDREESLELLDKVQQLVQRGHQVQNSLQHIAHSCSDKEIRKELIYHSHHVAMANVQLDVMSKLLLSARNDLSTYDGVVRTSARFLETVKNGFNATEQAYLKCFCKEDRMCDREDKEAYENVSAIIEAFDWKGEFEDGLRQKFINDSTIDELGLRRLEIDDRYTFSDLFLCTN